MELSKPTIVTPPQNLMTARTGKMGVDDPFFAHANHHLSDKDSSSPRLIVSSPGRGPARSCGCSSGSPVAPLK
jgi:hypothetical protein